MKDFRKKLVKDIKRDIEDKFSFQSSSPQNSDTESIARYRQGMLRNAIQKNVANSMVGDVADEIMNDINYSPMGEFQYGGGYIPPNYDGAIPYLDALNESKERGVRSFSNFMQGTGAFANSFEQGLDVRVKKPYRKDFREWKRGDRQTPFYVPTDMSSLNYNPFQRKFNEGGEQDQMVQVVAAYFQEIGVPEEEMQQAVERFMEDHEFREEITSSPEFQNFVNDMQGGGQEDEMAMQEQMPMDEGMPMMRFGGDKSKPSRQLTPEEVELENKILADYKRDFPNSTPHFRLGRGRTPHFENYRRDKLNNQSDEVETIHNPATDMSYLNNLNLPVQIPIQSPNQRFNINDFRRNQAFSFAEEPVAVQNYLDGTPSPTPTQTSSSGTQQQSSTTGSGSARTSTPATTGTNPAGRGTTTTKEEVVTDPETGEEVVVETEETKPNTRGNIGLEETTSTTQASGSQTPQSQYGQPNSLASVVTDRYGNQFFYNPSMFGLTDLRQRRDGTIRRARFQPLPEYMFNRGVQEQFNQGPFRNEGVAREQSDFNASPEQYSHQDLPIEPLSWRQERRLMNKRDRLDNRLMNTDNQRKANRLQRQINNLDQRLFVPGNYNSPAGNYNSPVRSQDEIEVEGVEANPIWYANQPWTVNPELPKANDGMNVGYMDRLNPIQRNFIDADQVMSEQQRMEDQQRYLSAMNTIDRVDLKSKTDPSNYFGYGVGAIASLSDMIGGALDERRLNQEVTNRMVGNNLFQTEYPTDRGHYTPNQGFTMPDQHIRGIRGHQVFPYVKYGGSLNRFQNGGEFLMSEQEIEDLRRQGYNVEYLD